MSLSVGVRRRVRWPVAGLAAVACWVAEAPVLAAFTDTEHNPQDVQAADEIDPPPVDALAPIAISNSRVLSSDAPDAVVTLGQVGVAAVGVAIAAGTMRSSRRPPEIH